MTERQQSEKGEKEPQMGEKEQEKTQEKQEEKSWDEKWRRDPLGSIAWAAILIWAGIVFLLDNLNWLQTWGPPFDRIEAWSLVFAGAGVIFLGIVLVRLLVPEYRRPVVGTLILALVFLGIGLGETVGWEIIWPIVLIALGAAFLLGGITRRG
jgi:NADH:ubiquinone oxidoreductase subunit H